VTRRQFLRKALRGVGLGAILAPNAHRIVAAGVNGSRWWRLLDWLDDFLWH